MVYNIRVRFNFFLNCHSYTLQKMFNLDDITNENIEDQNLKWPYIPDHPWRMLITASSGSGKINAVLTLIKNQDLKKILITRL